MLQQLEKKDRDRQQLILMTEDTISFTRLAFLFCADSEMAASTDTSFEEVRTAILDKIQSSDVKSETEIYLSSIGSKVNTDKGNENAEKWLQWARGCRHLKIVSFPVPAGVLPKDCNCGELLDVKVASRGPDDAVYDANQMIRQRVARGNCFLRIDGGPYRGSRLVLYGLKKFTGGLGDDDDRDRGDNHTWHRYFTKPMESAARLVATRKANGEAAHLSCIELAGQLLICAGSKNVHQLFRTREDIKRYHGDRFRIAGEISEVIMDILEQMDPTNKNRLLRFLAHTGYTAIFEILSPDHQHVEDLSHLPGNCLRFITWTSPDLDPTSDSELCTVPPHIGIEIARALGLPTVDYTILPVTAVEERMTKVRQGYQYEGEVLYFLDESGEVIGLLKKKTIWYIICRAVREKVRAASSAKAKNPSTFCISVPVKKMEKRLSEIQTWLGLDEETLAAWKVLAIGFLKWALAGIDAGTIRHGQIGDKFPVLWKRYLEESGSSDKINSHFHEPEEDASDL
ncbi:hypothetical protein BaRGS_00009927 [Batillaria attramentaria]|uniref:DUF7920 domain-containing protein n=1 Tax=Batillaria attramentaria TaxID=370345 RepID=A0ABD0LHG9_9CAEN